MMQRPRGASEASARLALLRVLQLSSSLLPIGAFAYSQGLETAVEMGWVTGEEDLLGWLGGVGEHSLCALDLPLLWCCRQAWSRGDADEAMAVSERLLSFRESRELREQERHLGSALARVLETLDVPEAAGLVRHESVSYVACYALGSVHFALDDDLAASGYAFAWSEQLVSAATRLIPLGHLSAQRVLSRVISRIPNWIALARDRELDDIGSLTPGLAMVAAWHETQYTRLFRS